MPRFSVIIPSFNRVHLLPIAIASVAAQSFDDWELIVVDDGSTDGTVDILNRYGSLIRLVRQKNGGPGLARNAGAAIATGEYLAFLDSDDTWFPWTLATYDTIVSRFGRPNLIGGCTFEFTELEDLGRVEQAEIKADHFPDYYRSCYRGYSVGANALLVLREAFEAASGFAAGSMNCEDHDLMMRLGEASGFVQVLRPFTIAYRRHHASETANLQKSLAGVSYLLRQEQQRIYPGGPKKALERRMIVSLHLRPVSLALVHHRRYREAGLLYLKALRWHLMLGRWKYLLGFPMYIMASLLGDNAK